MLEELVKKEDVGEEKNHLSNSFGLKMSSDIERRFAEMCNLSEVLIENGEKKALVDLVKDGLLDIEIAAERAHLTVEEFKKLMKKA